jgi:hypothetical protein
MKLHLPLFFLLLGLLGGLRAQCPAGQSEVRLEIDPDIFWNEISWDITRSDGTILADGAATSLNFAVYTYCVPDSVCLLFNMRDTYGDGMFPDGVYRIFYNGVQVFENLGTNFGHYEGTPIGCPQGAVCSNPFPADTLGVYHTPGFENNWYVLTPTQTGIYEISTCGLGNDCPSKIWLYNTCQGLVLTDDLTGSIYFSDSGCDTGAIATLYLKANQLYYLRVAYASDSCAAADPLVFNWQYLGPVTGCMDPEACNYDPFATIPDTCILPGDPDCPNLPDLVVREDVLRGSLELSFLAAADACMVEEGCLKGVGNRDLIRFTTQIDNIGKDDYWIGETPQDPATPSDQFVWDPCHFHWHYRGYAEYLLFNSATGQFIPLGSKNGFCVLDLTCPNGSGQYTCGNMGISAGCGDIYDSGLDCQWVDITGLDAGTYTLVVRVNWDRSLDKLGRAEASYDNNWAQACFNLWYNKGLPQLEVLENTCPSYTDCTGEVFGNAVIDCDGNCKGVGLFGDWNQDTLRTDADWLLYQEAALADDAQASNCRDLFDDDQIDVYDAALLQECTLHQNEASYWGVKLACQFPTGFENDNDLVELLPGELDEDNKTFDVMIANPFSKLLAYEFQVSGLKIASVENLAGNFDGFIRFDTTGELLAISGSETAIGKNPLPAGLLRIHYSELTDTVVCIKAITAIVNDKYQKSNASIAQPSCVNTGFVGTHEPGNTFVVYVQPNPFRQQTTLFFPNPDAHLMEIRVSDVSGRLLRQFSGVRAESVTITSENMTPGVYLYTVSGPQGSRTGKIVFTGK